MAQQTLLNYFLIRRLRQEITARNPDSPTDRRQLQANQRCPEAVAVMPQFPFQSLWESSGVSRWFLLPVVPQLDVENGAVF